MSDRSASFVSFPAPQGFSFAEPVAFGAVLRRGFAASMILQLSLSTDHLKPNQSMLSTLLLLSPFHKSNTGASLRDRASLPSPQSGLVPSGEYPSRLARRFATLTATCLPAAAVSCTGAPVDPPLSPHRSGAMRLARFGAAARPLTRRGGSPPVPVPEPFSPTFGTLV